ncbi:MAG: hypothetical protein QY317_16175 [Candidatus Jettenia caeni]|nr:MAG: hypothetical protein QY317_16175 [Candidatus Jettenia caeni]
MASIREQILSAILTALNTGRPQGVPQATREGKEYESSQLPSVTIRPQGEVVGQVHGRRGLIRGRQLKVVVECRGSGNIPDQALDTYLVWITKALDGNTLNGLANDMVEEGQITWLSEIADKTYGMATVEFTVYYQTKKGDQESRN